MGENNWFEAVLTVPGGGTGMIGALLLDGMVKTAPAPGLVPLVGLLPLIGGAEIISFGPSGF